VGVAIATSSSANSKISQEVDLIRFSKIETRLARHRRPLCLYDAWNVCLSIATGLWASSLEIQITKAANRWQHSLMFSAITEPNGNPTQYKEFVPHHKELAGV